MLSNGSLPEDGKTFEVSDGSGRAPVVFEFDTDGHGSLTQIDDAEPLSVSGQGNLTSNGTYLGTTAREYLIEFDSSGTTDTFRWSLNGGANFNDSLLPIPSSLIYNLSAGVAIEFNSFDAYEVGDRWRIKVAPVNQIVEVGRSGSYEERLEQTKDNLIRAINRARNQGLLALKAMDAHSHGYYGGGEPGSSLSDTTIFLPRW